MIKPIKFGYNEQTANSNSFQVLEKENDTNNIQERALREFNDLASKLKEKEIDVTIIEDTSKPHTPDSIFPNNWISFHENNTMVLYPMLAENRRRERRTDIITHFLKEYQTVIDLSQQEENSFFLEGTGSIVFDYENKIAYAAISPRTNKNLVYELCKQVNYTPIVFTALDSTNAAIYHTNVLMCVGTTFAVLCAESIPNQIEQHQILQSLENTKHEIITISIEQMNSFAGNMYQLFNKNMQSIILMSEQAYLSLTKEQVNQLKKHGELVYSPLYTIEKYGGGSARCMIADIRNS